MTARKQHDSSKIYRMAEELVRLQANDSPTEEDQETEDRRYGKPSPRRGLELLAQLIVGTHRDTQARDAAQGSSNSESASATGGSEALTRRRGRPPTQLRLVPAGQLEAAPIAATAPKRHPRSPGSR